MLHLDVSKVDRVLYIGCTWKAGGGACGLYGGAGDADAVERCLGGADTRNKGEINYNRIRPDVRALAVF